MQSLGGCGHVAQEFRCGLEIPIGIGNVNVTKISAQRRHVPPYSLTVSRTLLKRADCEGMPEVLNPAAAEPRTTAQAS